MPDIFSASDIFYNYLNERRILDIPAHYKRYKLVK